VYPGEESYASESLRGKKTIAKEDRGKKKCGGLGEVFAKREPERVKK